MSGNPFKESNTHLHINSRRTILNKKTQGSRGLGLHCGIRRPTYTTAGGGGGGGDAGLSDPGYGHASTIVSVVPIPVAEGDGIGGGSGGGGGKGGLGGMLSLVEANSFQVASLDDRGTVSIWLASEVPKVDEGGSQVRTIYFQSVAKRLSAASIAGIHPATSGNVVMLRTSLGCFEGSIGRHIVPAGNGFFVGPTRTKLIRSV